MDNGASSYRRFLDGDNEGFVEIINEYGPKLIFFINGLVHNIDVSEEIMEDTFCDLIFYKNRYRNKSSFKTYLFSIAKNKAYDYIKRNKSLSLNDYSNQLRDSVSLENKIVDNETKLELYSAMSKLNNLYYVFIYLYYFEDMSYDEIGKILHKNSRQLKNISYRSKESLKNILEKEEFFYEDKSNVD